MKIARGLLDLALDEASIPMDATSREPFRAALAAARAEGYRAGQERMRERADVIAARDDIAWGIAAAIRALPIEPEGGE